MLSCCLWRNVETSCHKHFIDISREQQTMPLTTSSSVTTCHSLAATCWQHLAAVTALTASWQWSQILAQNHDSCLPHLHSMLPWGGFPSEYCHAIWYGKTRMAWLPDCEKILKICLFVLTQLTNVTDRQTDTAWRHKPHLCIALRGKNDMHI